MVTHSQVCADNNDTMRLLVHQNIRLYTCKKRYNEQIEVHGYIVYSQENNALLAQKKTVFLSSECDPRK
jgi:hypothetical protein